MFNMNINYSLICAVRNGDMGRVRRLIDAYGQSASNAWPEGYVFLRGAIKNDQPEIAKLLLNGCNVMVNSRNTLTDTPLHFAVRNGNLEIVDMLLDRHAEINAKNVDGTTPLHIAVENGHENLVKLLLERGADVNIEDRYGRSVLYVAAANKHCIIVRRILEFCPDVRSKSNRTALHVAVRERCCLIVEYLLEYGFYIERENVNDYELLDAAVTEGYLGIVEQLLKYGADVDTPLHKATKNKVEGAVNLLVNYGADVNYKDMHGRTAIFYAARNTDLNIFYLLLPNSDTSIIDKDGQSLLHFTALETDELSTDAVDNARGAIAKMVLSQGANVNAQNRCGNTPLHIAVQSEFVQVIEALLEHNADVDCSNQWNKSPLHLSAKQGNKVITEMLLNKGANVNARERNGLTPLYKAIEGGHKNVVEVLLEHGAHLDCMIRNNLTPLLHFAAAQRCCEIIKTMLKFGADVNSRDHDGSIALHVASRNGRKEIVLTLLEYGADINVINKNNQTPLIAANCTKVYVIHYNLINEWDLDIDYEHDSLDLTGDILQCHIVKMTTAGLYVSRENLDAMYQWYGKMDNFENDCEQEIVTMKSEKIYNTNITFYDILSKGINQLVLCIRNEHITSVLKPDNIGKKFPLYCSMLQDRVRKGLERKRLLEQGDRIFQFLRKNLPSLPLPCTERIFSYLSNKDLKNFIGAGEW
uniref:Uncharacterized protein n=1 Tax=Photinus pyralis TaxID=7054 RepID=A0A1Y1NLE7_PHOPY